MALVATSLNASSDGISRLHGPGHVQRRQHRPERLQPERCDRPQVRELDRFLDGRQQRVHRPGRRVAVARHGQQDGLRRARRRRVVMEREPNVLSAAHDLGPRVADDAGEQATGVEPPGACTTIDVGVPAGGPSGPNGSADQRCPGTCGSWTSSSRVAASAPQQLAPGQQRTRAARGRRGRAPSGAATPPARACRRPTAPRGRRATRRPRPCWPAGTPAAPGSARRARAGCACCGGRRRGQLDRAPASRRAA